MEIDIARLQALAQAATPGPWTYSRMTETEDPEIGAANGSRVALLVAADVTKANSAFIAAANPAVVLELLEIIADRTKDVLSLTAQRDVVLADTMKLVEKLDRIRALGEISMCECDQIYAIVNEDADPDDDIDDILPLPGAGQPIEMVPFEQLANNSIVQAVANGIAANIPFRPLALSLPASLDLPNSEGGEHD